MPLWSARGGGTAQLTSRAWRRQAAETRQRKLVLRTTVARWASAGVGKCVAAWVTWLAARRAARDGLRRAVRLALGRIVAVCHLLYVIHSIPESLT